MNQTRKRGKAHRYEIHDNGGRPFFVDIQGKNVTVWKNMNKHTFVNKVYKEIKLPLKELFTIQAEKIFLGTKSKTGGYDGVPPSKAIGNSILLQTSGTKYIYIGSEIFEFQTIDKDAIQKYYSDIGNSDVPYPYAIGKTHVYIMLDKVAVDKTYFDMKKNIYEQYYFEQSVKMCLKGNPKTDLCKDKEAVKERIREFNAKKVSLKIKQIEKRDW